MRTVRNLFLRLCSPDHLEQAARATVRGKRHRPDVAWFLFHLDDELATLREDLVLDRYRPSGFRLLAIRDPKPRLIARVEIRDRVLHTALVQLIEPAFAASLSPDAFACRTGYGGHRAVLRLQELLRAHRWVVHLDIKSYFPSIDVDLLLGLLGRRLRDPRFLRVVEKVLEAGRGLYDAPEVRRFAGLGHDWPPPGRGIPIGSYTSQLFAAQIYLNDFDHYLKRELKVPGFLRYVDDVFCFADDRHEIESWRAPIESWLWRERGLRLKHPGARVLACQAGLDALGYRLDREVITVRRRALPRLARRALPAGAGKREVDRERSLLASSGSLVF